MDDEDVTYWYGQLASDPLVSTVIVHLSFPPKWQLSSQLCVSVYVCVRLYEYVSFPLHRVAFVQLLSDVHIGIINRHSWLFYAPLIVSSRRVSTERKDNNTYCESYQNKRCCMIDITELLIWNCTRSTNKHAPRCVMQFFVQMECYNNGEIGKIPPTKWDALYLFEMQLFRFKDTMEFSGHNFCWRQPSNVHRIISQINHFHIEIRHSCISNNYVSSDWNAT